MGKLSGISEHYVRNNYMRNLIGAILVSSIHNLFSNQPNILSHTGLTTMTEWNFGHHLVNEIVNYIFWLDHDLDVVKGDKNLRPDIIFHKRDICELDFLVIEVKINRTNSEDI